MALISATTIISSLSVFHLISAYFLLTNPSVVLTHNLVTVISAAVCLPVPDANNPSAMQGDASGTTPLLAAVLLLYGACDLAAASLPKELSSLYWGSQTPVRLLFFFVLTAWSYSGRPGGWSAGRAESLALAAEAEAAAKGGKVAGGILGAGLGSGLVFSWAFLEMIGWFWVFITLRDERREAVVKDSEKDR